ncbi:MAG TPA: tripartite tricarboxylate transporter TctB family protein [Dongiaceae bacterium]|nr:tripartite tricarboxylate transporter TctB family protein [Dongiaceae bacterium]
MTRDLVSGCILFVFSIVYYTMASAIPVSVLADSVGAQGLPKSYGIALGILSLLLIVQALYARRRAAATVDLARATATNQHDKTAALRAVGMLAIGVVYVLLLPWLGYVVSLALLIVTTVWYQERHYRHKLWPVAIIGAVVFWLIFVELLEIAEPAGFWPSLI